MVNVPADSVYRMGVNSVDRAEIRVDGRRIVTVAGCGRAFPREVAYDTYLFNDYVSLKLTRGEHRVDILSTGKISFGLVDSLDFQVRNVSYIVIEHENKAKEFRIPIKRRLRLQNIPMPSGIMPMVLQCWDCWLWPMRQGEERYAEHVRRFCDFTMEHLPLFAAQYERGFLRTQNYRMFRRGMLDDTTAPALPFLETAMRYGATAEQCRLLASMADYAMREQPRLVDGTFVRPEPRWTIWCDDLFMSAVFDPLCPIYGRG